MESKSNYPGDLGPSHAGLTLSENGQNGRKPEEGTYQTFRIDGNNRLHIYQSVTNIIADTPKFDLETYIANYSGMYLILFVNMVATTPAFPPFNDTHLLSVTNVGQLHKGESSLMMPCLRKDKVLATLSDWDVFYLSVYRGVEASCH